MGKSNRFQGSKMTLTKIQRQQLDQIDYRYYVTSESDGPPDIEWEDFDFLHELVRELMGRVG